MYDNKLTVFMNAVSTDCQDMITKNSILVKDDILCQKKNISKIESRFHKSVNQIQKDMNNNKCECTDNLPKWTDFDMLKKNTVSGQQSVLYDIDELKIKNENMESKIQALHRRFHVSKEIMKSRDFTTDMHTLTSRCETIEAKVDSLGSAITDSSILHEVQRLHGEMKIVQLNLSNIKAVSKTQPDRQLNKTTVITST